MKVFLRSVTGLVVIIILGAVIFGFIFWSRIPDIVASNMSKKLKVPVEIADIDLSMKSIEIDKLEIGNPKGYYLPRAFGAEHIAIDAPLSRYFHDHILIDEIDVDNVYVGLEFDSPKGTEGNWTQIMKNVHSSASQKSKKTVLIHKLILSNIKCDLLYRSQGKKVTHLPEIKRIELHDISSEGGGAMDQIMNSALGEMIKQVFVEQNMKDALNNILDQIQGGGNSQVQQGIQIFRGLFGDASSEEND